MCIAVVLRIIHAQMFANGNFILPYVYIYIRANLYYIRNGDIIIKKIVRTCCLYLNSQEPQDPISSTSIL